MLRSAVEHGERRFCSAAERRSPTRSIGTAAISVTVGSLDDPEAVPPTAIWHRSEVSWVAGIHELPAQRTDEWMNDKAAHLVNNQRSLRNETEERRWIPLNLPRPAWMTEDLVLLEEQARRFIAAEFVPHIEHGTRTASTTARSGTRPAQAGLLCAGIPEEYGGAGGTLRA